ncbi:MAG: BTAD domain-containing putative transcriptional regulator, partial [Ignavibacteria bacterium]
YMTHALKKINNNFGGTTLQFIESAKQEETRFQGLGNVIREIVGTFINDFYNNFKKDVFLVIDDLHNIKNTEWLKLTFNKLIDNFPENLHLLITSRELPDFNLTKLSAKRNIFQIQSYDLNFTHEEIADLLENIYTIAYNADDVYYLEDKLGGWITGIHLVIQAYGKNFGKAKFQSQNIPENIFIFFANEIFENLEEKTQEFLLNTALLDFIDPGICDSLLGINESSNIISDLLSKNIFIQPTTDMADNSKFPNSYTYQNLFKKFLLTKLFELKSKEEIKIILKRFCQYHLSINDLENAINYSLLAEDYTTATPLIIDNFQKIFNEGKFESLWKWLDSIKENIITNIPQLLYFKGLLYKYYSGNLDKSLEHLQKAITLLEKQNEKKFLINCYISKAEVLINLGKTDEVLKDLTRLIKVNTTPENKAKLNYFLGYAYFINSEYEKSLELLNTSLEICEEEKLKDIPTDIFNVLGNIYINRGEYIKATYYYEKVVEKSTNVYKKFVTICNLVLVLSRSGKYEKAKTFLNQAEELLKRFSTPIFQTAYLLAKYDLHFGASDYEEGIKILEKVNEIAKKINRKDHIYLSYELLAETYYYMDKLNKSNEYYELAKNYIDEGNKLDKLGIEVEQALLQKKIKLNDGIGTVLLKAYNEYDLNMFLESKVKVGFHLADYYLKINFNESSIKYLEECLNISAEKEYVSFLERELFDSRKPFDFAINNKIQKGFIKTITESLLDRKNFNWLSNECLQRVSNQIDNLFDINMNCFGGLEFKVRGKVIPEEKWIRKKRKLILAYLLLFPNNPLTKDKIIDLFYPETPLESADNIFHQTISNIRNALRNDTTVSKSKSPSTKKSQPVEDKTILTSANPSFALYEDKILKLNPDYVYKVDAIEFNKLYKSANSAETKADKKIEYAKKATELYKGELLAGYYEPWCEDLRQEYSNKFINLCEEIIEVLKKKKLYEEVIIYSEKLIQADKLNEDAYLNIIEAYTRLNNINRAKDKFAQMLKTYEEELDEKPAKEILEKIKAILS